MKWKWLFALCIILTLVVSSCINTPDTLPSERPSDVDVSPVNNDNTLVWAIPGIVTLVGGEGELGEQWQEAIDEALREKGADFTVRFLPVGNYVDGYLGPGEDGLLYHEKVIKMIEDGTQIDVAYIGAGAYDYLGDAYMDAYQAGITTPLDEFLQSETGRVIYDKYPENVWNAMRINGEIEGIFSSASGEQYGYTIKKDWLAANPSFDLSALNGNLSSLEGALPPDIEVLVQVSFLQQTIACMYEMVSIAPGIVLDNGVAYAFYEHDATIDFLRSLHKMPDPDPDVLEKAGGEDALWGIMEYPDVYPTLSNDYVTHLVSKPDLSSERLAIVINQHSEHKEQALQLLSWLHSDPELADLLLYGVEGVHYTRDGGMIYAAEGAPVLDLVSSVFTGTNYLATPLAAIDLPNPEYYAGASERALAYMETLPNAPHTGFHLDSRGWEETLNRLDEIIKRHTERTIENDYYLPDFLRGLDENWEQTLAALNAELAEAGIHDLVAEVNKQYTEWSALYSPVK